LLKCMKGIGRYNTVCLLPDGIAGKISSIVYNLYQVMGMKYKFSGGGAGDNLKFIKTCQFIDEEIYTNSILGIGIVSSIPQGIGVRHGWKPIGRSMVVTKSKENVVYELDGRPAFEAYRDLFEELRYKGLDFLGKKPELSIEKFGEFAMRHPLGLVQRGEYTIRDPLRAEKDGSLICVADVPSYSHVRIMEGNNENLINAAVEAAKVAKEEVPKPSFALIFDCVSRLLILGNDARREIKLVRTQLGNVPSLGFFTFGEVGSVTGPPLFHNKTIVVHLL